VTSGESTGPSESTRGETPADEEYARRYAEGYGEGLRSALREVLSHTTRGHTAQELRILVESRLARVNEEVELKRRSLLSPPRRPAWNSLLRVPAPVGARPWTPPIPGPAPDLLAPGRSLLIREERPRRAVELLRESASKFPRVVLVSAHPPDLEGVPADRRVVISLGAPGGAGRPSAGEIGGRLKEPTQAEGGALVYVDALELIATEEGPDTVVRFVGWLVDLAARTRSALLVSFDARALELKDASRLERAFAQVIATP